MLQLDPTWVTNSDFSTLLVDWLMVTVCQGIRHFSFAFCKSSKHSVLCLTLAVESTGALVGVELSPLGSFPGRNTFVFTKQ